MPEPGPGEENPSYNMRYGWHDGAQNDAVVSKNKRDYVPPQGRALSRRSTARAAAAMADN